MKPKKGKLYRLLDSPLSGMTNRLNKFGTVEKGFLPGIDLHVADKNVLMCLQDAPITIRWNPEYLCNKQGTVRGWAAENAKYNGYTFYTNYKTIFIVTAEAEERLEEIV